MFSFVIRDAYGMIAKRLPMWHRHDFAMNEARHWLQAIALRDHMPAHSYSIGTET